MLTGSVLTAAGKTLDEADACSVRRTPRRKPHRAPISADLDAIVAKAMRKEPQQRYTSGKSCPASRADTWRGCRWGRSWFVPLGGAAFVARHRFGQAALGCPS